MVDRFHDLSVSVEKYYTICNWHKARTHLDGHSNVCLSPLRKFCHIHEARSKYQQEGLSVEGQLPACQPVQR